MRRSSQAEGSVCILFVHDIVLVCMVWYFGGNSLSFGLTVLDFVSGTSDDRGKAKA